MNILNILFFLTLPFLKNYTHVKASVKCQYDALNIDAIALPIEALL